MISSRISRQTVPGFSVEPGGKGSKILLEEGGKAFLVSFVEVIADASEVVLDRHENVDVLSYLMRRLTEKLIFRRSGLLRKNSGPIFRGIERVKRVGICLNE